MVVLSCLGFHPSSSQNLMVKIIISPLPQFLPPKRSLPWTPHHTQGLHLCFFSTDCLISHLFLMSELSFSPLLCLLLPWTASNPLPLCGLWWLQDTHQCTQSVLMILSSEQHSILFTESSLKPSHLSVCGTQHFLLLQPSRHSFSASCSVVSWGIFSSPFWTLPNQALLVLQFSDHFWEPFPNAHRLLLRTLGFHLPLSTQCQAPQTEFI